MEAKPINNSVIKSFLTTKAFAKNTNAHKYAILWTSKFYRFINQVMRRHSFNVQQTSYPYAVRYIKHFIHYFDTFGITKSDLKVATLFRGITADFTPGASIVDTAFIATSTDLHIAQSFAGKKGMILTFRVSDLPQDIKFIQIDSSISSHLQESEILLLPGKVTISRESNTNYCIYECNMDLVNMYKSLPGTGGGLEADDIPMIDLADKLFVWYRAINDRPVEILAQITTPSDKDKVYSFVSRSVMRMDDRIQRINNYIPEYQDMLKTSTDIQRINSFEIFVAVYDYKKRAILTLHYGMPDDFFANMFDTKRTDEVISYIRKTYDWM